MNKNEFNLLAIRVIQEEKHSKERALERLEQMEDVCFITGKSNLIPKITAARLFIQKKLLKEE